jgi:hypothetical protein
MGSGGETKRTDLMGLLMMISPPGYGKTTLMEYVANRLGLIFMKINCPSLGHDVLSLDPEQAPNATAAQELNKLNLALEMSNNVMLYLYFSPPSYNDVANNGQGGKSDGSSNV